jgi:4-amino-4-deoxy-L-arabinose transferase-like glycosyltransferase
LPIKTVFVAAKKYILTAILLGSFLLCLLYAFAFRIAPVVDAKAYDRIAANIAEGYGFREDPTLSYEFDHAITRAGPGYEFFLAGLYRVFGHRLEPAWAAQALLHALSALLVYLVFRRLFRDGGEAPALVAAALFGFWPDLIEISAMLLTETLYLFLTMLVVWVFTLAYDRPQSKAFAALLGAAAGVAILTRPPLLLFVPIIAFFYWNKKSYAPLAAFGACVALPIAPWVARNYLIYHKLILTTMIGEYNLWLGNTLASTGGQFNDAANPLNDFVNANGFFGLKAKASAEFWGFISAHPLIFLKLCLIRFIRYFSLIRPMGFWFYQSGISQMAFVASSLVWIAGVFVAGCSGLVTALRHREEIMWYIAAFTLPRRYSSSPRWCSPAIDFKSIRSSPCLRHTPSSGGGWSGGRP